MSTTEDGPREDIRNDRKFVKTLTQSIQGAFQAIPEQMKTGYDKISGTIASNTSEVMGASLNGVLNDLKAMTSGVKDMLVGAFSSMFGSGSVEEETLEENQEQTSLLHKLVKFFKFDRMRFRPEGEEPGMIPAMLAAISAGLLLVGTGVGMALGVLLSPLTVMLEYFLIPFKLVWDVLKLLGKKVEFIWVALKETKIFKWLGGMWELIASKFNLIFNPFKLFFTKVGGIFTSIGGFIMKIPILGTLFKGIGLGFMKVFRVVPVIGWAITAIMGVIDFFSAFNSKQGTFIEKLKAGLTGLLSGFFDPIFDLLGWVADKVLGWFGIEVEGGCGAKMKEGFANILNGLWDTIESIITSVWGFIKNIGGYIKSLWDNFDLTALWEGIVTYVKGIGTSIVEFWATLDKKGLIENIIKQAEDLLSSIWKWITDHIPGWDDIKDKFSKGMDQLGDIFSWEDAKDEPPTAQIPQMEAEKAKAEAQKNKEIYDATQKMVAELEKNRIELEKQNKAKDTTSTAPNFNVVTGNGNVSRGSSNDFKEAPDEIENFGLCFMNKTTLGGNF